MKQSNAMGFLPGVDSPSLRFTYKNWKGVTEEREVKGVPVFWYGESAYHMGTQWFLRAFDTEKQDLRDFCMKDIIAFL